MIELLTSCTEANIRFFGKQDTVPEECIRLRQVHGIRTVRADMTTKPPEEADGLATDVQGISVLIRIADCQNFAIIAPEHGVIGALHAGWKGLIAGAIEEHFAFLEHTWNIRPSDVWVAAGPSLCTECAEFSDPIRELPGIDTRFFEGRMVDLRGIADDKLRRLGVQPERMERHPDCTRCHPERYWSYRAEPKSVIAGQHNSLVCSLKGK